MIRSSSSISAIPHWLYGRTTVIVAAAPCAAWSAACAREVDVGDAVGVGEAEAPAGEPLGGARDPAAGGGLEPGVDALDLDRLGPRRSAAANASICSPR